MREEKATVDGKEVTILIPDTPEEAAELQRRVQSGEMDTTDSGDASTGTVSRAERLRALFRRGRKRR